MSSYVKLEPYRTEAHGCQHCQVDGTKEALLDLNLTAEKLLHLQP